MFQEREGRTIQSDGGLQLQVVPSESQRLRESHRRADVDALETPRLFGCCLGRRRFGFGASFESGSHLAALGLLGRTVLLHFAELVSPPAHVSFPPEFQTGLPNHSIVGC